MAFSSSGAMGVIDAKESQSMRLARDLRIIQRKHGYLFYDAVIKRGWRHEDVAMLLSEALDHLRSMCWSHWPTCPHTIVVDDKLMLVMAEDRNQKLSCVN